MVDLPKKKIGIVACSGEELPEGTITRLAALRVLEQLRPNATVTICLPLFLAGGEGDRAFARFYPTISIDGCELRCAARATEMYSHRPAAAIMVRDLIKEHNLDQPLGRRHLNDAGIQAVEITAAEIAGTVDDLLGREWSRKQAELIQIDSPENARKGLPAEHGETRCACQSGIPIQKVVIAEKEVSLVGLALIFHQFSEAEKNPGEDNLRELMETIKIYNPIHPDEEPAYRDAIWKAYRNYWFTQKGK